MIFGSFFQLSKIEGLKSVTEFPSRSSNEINFHVSFAAVVVFMIIVIDCVKSCLQSRHTHIHEFMRKDFKVGGLFLSLLVLKLAVKLFNERNFKWIREFNEGKCLRFLSH